MVDLQARNSRHEEIADIVEARSGDVAETRDEANKYTVVGAADRRSFANWLTPIVEYFVCHRNDIPEIDAETWTVSLEGQVDGDLSISEIRDDYPMVAVAPTMECAGNGRGQHQPETGSVQWGFEAAADAFWTGTPVRSILRGQGVESPGEKWLTTPSTSPAFSA